MEMSTTLTLPLIVLLLICKMSWAVSEIPMGDEQHSSHTSQNTLIGDDEKRGVGTQDLVRRFLMALNKNYPYDVHGRLGGIPFRPARRIGSEFLGKRGLDGDMIGTEMDSPAYWDHSSPGKRARAQMGSEFLGKRRLGSEFLGKRTPPYDLNINELSSEEPEDVQDIPLAPSSWNYQPGSPSFLSSSLLPKSYEKRALGSEFLGKRRSGGGYDWTWKRARLGSEFLGKRALGSEFLGKRSGLVDDSGFDYPPHM